MIILIRDNNDFYLLSKGDNNSIDDRGLYEDGRLWLHKDDLMGKVRGYLPYMGMFTIWLNDYPLLKWGVLSMMVIFVVIAKDP